MLLDFVETVVASGSGTYPITVVLLTVLVSLIYWSVRRPNGMPPGPTGLPIVGSMFSKYNTWEGNPIMLRQRNRGINLIAHAKGAKSNAAVGIYCYICLKTSGKQIIIISKTLTPCRGKARDHFNRNMHTIEKKNRVNKLSNFFLNSRSNKLIRSLLLLAF